MEHQLIEFIKQHGPKALQAARPVWNILGLLVSDSAFVVKCRTCWFRRAYHVAYINHGLLRRNRHSAGHATRAGTRTEAIQDPGLEALVTNMILQLDEKRVLNWAWRMVLESLAQKD